MHRVASMLHGAAENYEKPLKSGGNRREWPQSPRASHSRTKIMIYL